MGTRRSERVVMEIATTDRMDITLAGKKINVTSRKARAVLGYLLLNESHAESREHLVGLLWGETDEDKARGSLRHCIKELRLAVRGTDFPGFQFDKQTLVIDPQYFKIDLWDIQAQAKLGEAHPKLLETPGLIDKLLKDLESVDSVFQTWLFAKRQSLNGSLIRHLEDTMRASPSADRKGEDVARAILNLDPTHEEACRHLMRARAHHGDIGGALKCYTALWQLLDEDYDVEPTDQTQTLFAELKAALPLAGPPGAVPSVVQIGAPLEAVRRNSATKLVLSIAPFDLAGVAPDRRYIVQGFRSELIAYLVRFREWMVREQPPGDAHALAPDEYVLQAQTMPFKQGVRLVLSLRECATNAYLWGNGLELESVDWNEAQQSVVRRIAAALNIHVSSGRLAEIGPRSGVDLLAYDMWLRGQTEQMPHTASGWSNAADLYRSIIAQHPTFAPAFSSLAQLQNAMHFVHPGLFRNVQTTEDALRFAMEAVRLDPMDSRSQLCLGWANAMAGRHDQAAVHHKLAVELNESDAWTCCSSALGFAFRGDFEQARATGDRALSLAPAPTGLQWRYQAMIRYLTNDFEGCVAAALHAEHSIQNVLVWKAASLVQLGQIADAKAAADEFFEAVTQRWVNPELPPSREAMTRWFLHAFPIKSKDCWERLRDDFGRAGADVTESNFETW